MEDVIVVGAGPTGLWLAAELRRAEVPVLVLDRAEAPDQRSRALTVHPRMIEMLAMRGMEKPFLDEGYTLPLGHFAQLDTWLDFRPLPTRHPYTLIFPQARTEELLQERAIELGARVRRGHAVTGLRQDGEAVELSVTGPEGPYAVRARWVVGGDGAGSTVRQAAGIPFPGTDATVYGFLGDVRLDDPPPPDQRSVHTRDGALMFGALPGGYHRIVGIVPEQPDGPGTEPTLEELRAKVVRVLGRDPYRERDELMRDVCFIADVAVLPRWIRVSQALDYVAGVHPRFDRRRAEECLAKTDIRMRSRVRELSKGMVTQLHLALILAIDARLLVLDEPTLGLDLLYRRQFYDTLVNDYFDKERTILLTTHQVEEIENLLTDVIFINHGHITLESPVESLAERYVQLIVNSDQVSRARELKPFYEREVFGRTAMFFEGRTAHELQPLGDIRTPSIADLFVAKMQAHATA